jgi:antitoxin component YwqK of YwqJK toxin-antitoxin module
VKANSQANDLNITYKFGLLAGPYKTFFKNGTPATSGEYRNNRLTGLFTAYHPNGKVSEQGEYVANKRHNEWKEYNAVGELIKTVTYKAGAVVTETENN